MLTEKKQTAVEWLLQRLPLSVRAELVEIGHEDKALAMEREQHNMTWVDSAIVISHEENPETFEEYWQDIYGKEESNE